MARESLGYAILINGLKQKNIEVISMPINDEGYTEMAEIANSLNCSTDWIDEAQCEWEELDEAGFDYASIDYGDVLNSIHIAEFTVWYEINRDEQPYWTLKGITIRDNAEEEVLELGGLVLITNDYELLFSKQQVQDALKRITIQFDSYQ